MEGESSIKDLGCFTEQVSDDSIMSPCDGEGSTFNHGSIPEHQEDTEATDRLKPMISTVDQSHKLAQLNTRQGAHIRTARPHAHEASSSPTSSIAIPRQDYSPQLWTSVSAKRRVSSKAYSSCAKRARDNESRAVLKTEDVRSGVPHNLRITHFSAVDQIIDHITPSGTEGYIDLGEQQVLGISQTRRKRRFLKELVDNVPREIKPQARRDRKELLDATKQINRVSTIRLADNVNQDAPWNITGMISTLHHHQVIAVGTMLHWETRDSIDHPRGGIIADDMGLGKTVQALALIAIHRPDGGHLSQGRSATLVVCPAGLTTQWFRQVKQHVNDKIIPRVHIYKSNECTDGNVLDNIDIIITSYKELTASESNTANRNAQTHTSNRKDWEKEERGWLHRRKWLRVICDEAHNFKNHLSKTFQAVHKLDTLYRWALSGTPITNGLEELYPYLKWLEMRCAADRKQFIASYCSRNDEEAMERLQILLKGCMVRRTMGSQFFGRAIVWLPPSHRQIEEVQLSHQERVLYEVLFDKYKTIIKNWNDGGQLQKNQVNALNMVTTLRQTASHVSLAQSAVQKYFELEDIVVMKEKLEEVDPGGERHLMDLITLWIRQAKGTPVIVHLGEKVTVEANLDKVEGAPTTARDSTRTQESREYVPWLSADGTLLQSAKIALLKQRLASVFSEAPGDKVVIYTHFIHMMSIIARLCQDHNWTCISYNGDMTTKRRDNIVQAFQDDNGPQILIASVKAAGEGLTLTQASHVFCCEMWWNSACDQQAFCRVYRIGQTRETSFSRLKAIGTIDDRIHEIQEAKNELITGMVTDDQPGNDFTTADILATFGFRSVPDRGTLLSDVSNTSGIDEDDDDDDDDFDDDGIECE